MEAQTREWAEALRMKAEAIQDSVNNNIAEVYADAGRSLDKIQEEMWETMPESLYDGEDPRWDVIFDVLELGPCMSGEDYLKISTDKDGIMDAQGPLYERI